MKKIFLKCTTFFLILMSFSAFVVSVSAQDKKNLKKAQKFVKDGDESFKNKNYQGAVANYSQAIDLVKDYPYAHFWKGNAYYYLQQYQPALEELNKAYDQKYTPLINIYRVRWFVNYSLKNYDQALSDLKQAAQIEPENIQFKVGLADTYYAKGSYQDALSIYNKIIGKVPNNGNTYYNIADANYKLGDLSKSKDAAEKAIQNGSQYMAEANILIGKTYQKERKYAEAANYYEKSLKLKKDNYDLYRSLSDVYRNMNRFDEAVQITKRALEEFPRDGNLYTDLSWYYSLADRNGNAVGSSQIAISLLPNQYQGYTYLCRAYNDLKEYSKAIAACNDALKLNPEDGETNFYIGRAYEFSGKPEVAVKYYKQAVTGLIAYTEKYPDFADGYYLLGNAYFSTGMKDKAIESYLKSLEFSPKFKKARYNLGYVYIQNGDLNSAETQYTALLELDKDLAKTLKEAMPKQ